MKTKIGIASAAAVVVALLATTWVLNSTRTEHASGRPAPDRLVAEASAPEHAEQPIEREVAPLDPRAGEQPARPTTGSIRVRVLHGDDRTPAAGVIVEIHWITKSGKPGRSLWKRTGIGGEARFTDVLPGEILLLANNTQRREGIKLAPGEEKSIEYQLDGILLTGVVVDSTGTPVPNAQVLLFDMNGMKGKPITHSDTRGRFVLRRIGRGSYVGAKARGFAPSLVQFVFAEDDERRDVTITLSGLCGTVVGRIVDANGAGVPGADIQIGDRGYYESVTLADGARAQRPRPARAVTDAEGRFEAIGVPTGSQPVLVKTDTHAPYHGTVEILAHERVEWNASLIAGVRCVGVVTDASGKPVSAVGVSTYNRSTQQSASALTGDDGRFEVSGLSPGAIELSVRSGKRGEARKKIEGKPGETVRCDLQLSRGFVVRGTITDTDGKPVFDARVTIRAPWPLGQSPFAAIVSTDSEGRFEAPNCPEGDISLRVDRREYKSIEDLWTQTSRSPISLRLEHEGKSRGRVVGRITDPAGAAVGMARVWVVREGARPPTPFYGFAMNNRSQVPLDPAGAFELDRLRPGTYHLLAKTATYPLWRSAKFTLRQGETHDAGRLVLVQGGRARFVLRNISPDAAIRLMVFRVGDRHGATIDRVHKPMRSPALAPGRYVVRVLGSSVVPLEVPFTVLADREVEVVVAVKSGVSVGLQFDVPRNPSPIEVTAVATRADGRRFAFRSHRFTGGHFLRILGLPPGSYELLAKATGGATGTATFRVVADVPKRMNVQVRLR